MPEICSLATPPRLPRPFAGLDREGRAAGWWLVAGGWWLSALLRRGARGHRALGSQSVGGDSHGPLPVPRLSVRQKALGKRCLVFKAFSRRGAA